MLKRVGTEARHDMEDFFRKKVFLELYVKVTKDWKGISRWYLKDLVINRAKH